MKPLIKKSKTVTQKPTILPNLLNVQELCRRYGVSVSLLYKAISAREIPFYRFGRRNYFIPEEADKYFLKRCRHEAK